MDGSIGLLSPAGCMHACESKKITGLAGIEKRPTARKQKIRAVAASSTPT
jgi:hypothetical protein